MKLALLSLALLATAPFAQAQHTAFDHDPANALPPGTVLHFVKSARDGSRPWKLDLYVASPTRIDVVKWAEGASDFVEVAADIDLARAMPVVMQQWNTQASGREPRLYAAVEQAQLQVRLANGMQLQMPAGGPPLHLWGFDLMGLAFMLPHLAKPEQAFELDIIDPNRPNREGNPGAQSVVRFEPAGEETIDGAPSRKYRLSGEVFGEQIGWLWVNKDTGLIERAEHPVPTSTDWPDWKLDFVGRERIDGIAWEGFKKQLADQLGAGATRSLAAAMQQAHADGGLEALIEGIPGWRDEALKGLEGDLNTFAYTLLGQGNRADALALFQRIARDFPQSANAWDSLGEAQLEAGDREAARASYRKVLELDPGNEHATAQLGKLGQPH